MKNYLFLAVIIAAFSITLIINKSKPQKQPFQGDFIGSVNQYTKKQKQDVTPWKKYTKNQIINNIYPKPLSVWYDWKKKRID